MISTRTKHRKHECFVQIFAVGRLNRVDWNELEIGWSLSNTIRERCGARARREAGSVQSYRRWCNWRPCSDSLRAFRNTKSCLESAAGERGGYGLVGRDRERAKASENDRLKQTHEPHGEARREWSWVGKASWRSKEVK